MQNPRPLSLPGAKGLCTHPERRSHSAKGAPKRLAGPSWAAKVGPVEQASTGEAGSRSGCGKRLPRGRPAGCSLPAGKSGLTACLGRWVTLFASLKLRRHRIHRQSAAITYSIFKLIPNRSTFLRDGSNMRADLFTVESSVSGFSQRIS